MFYTTAEEQPSEILEGAGDLELFREYGWDFENDEPMISNGDLVVVEANEAVKVWVFNALRTEKNRYMAFEGNFGQGFDSIIGSSFTTEAKKMEIKRIMEECLYISPYIRGIQNFDARLEEESLAIEATLETVYGEVDVVV